MPVSGKILNLEMDKITDHLDNHCLFLMLKITRGLKIFSRN